MEYLVLLEYKVLWASGYVKPNTLNIQITSILAKQQPSDTLVLQQLHRRRKCDAQTSTSEFLLFLVVASDFLSEKWAVWFPLSVSGPCVGVGHSFRSQAAVQ